jgi:putative polyhydroxyalkanoate system protein
MADIDLTRSHSLGVDGGRRVVEAVAEDLTSELGVDYRWDDDTLRFNGRGAEGRIQVAPDTIRVRIDLSFFLRTMRSRIRSEAERRLDQHLG